jgi:predicted lipid-binding transport protein (Tim44 family)
MALSLFAFVGLSQIVMESYVDARAGGGRSGGFRGTRSARPPAAPLNRRIRLKLGEKLRRHRNNPPRSRADRRFHGGLGIAMLGGFLGSMLFSGIANAGFGGFGGSGFGMIEILLLAGLGYFLLRKFRRPAAATNYGSMQYQDTQPYSAPSSAPALETPAPPVNNDIDYRSLTMMDRSFDPARFLKTAQDTFFKVQGAWNKQDTAALSALCGRELMQTWQEELNHLQARGQQNRMENIALRESEISEVWTENGEDFITVRLHANLLDYTVDTKTGAVVMAATPTPSSSKNIDLHPSGRPERLEVGSGSASVVVITPLTKKPARCTSAPPAFVSLLLNAIAFLNSRLRLKPRAYFFPQLCSKKPLFSISSR